MSILLATVFPLALSSGMASSGVAAALPAPAPAIPLSVAAQPAKAQSPRPVQVKLTPPTTAPVPGPAPVPAPAVVTPAVVAPQAPEPQLIPIQQPGPAPAALPGGPTADRATIIARVEKALTDVKTAQGKFSQVDAQGRSSSGAFYISRPGRIRFEYDKPEPMFIVSDGVSVSIEEPKRDAYDAVPLSSTPLHLFLRSNVDLRRDGSVDAVSSANGSHFVTMVDRTGEAEGKMILEFRASDFELLGWRSLNGAGEETRVKLSDVRKNISLKPSLFVVKDPADRTRDRR